MMKAVIRIYQLSYYGKGCEIRAVDELDPKE